MGGDYPNYFCMFLQVCERENYVVCGKKLRKKGKDIMDEMCV